MKKIFFHTLVLTLILTACTSNALKAGSTNQGLSAQTQLAIGMLRLEDTDTPVTLGQAKDLLPMWYVLQDLNESNATTQKEIDGLVDQIQETMTSDQTKAIKQMNLTQKDVLAAIQNVSTSNVSLSTSPAEPSTSGGGSGFGAPPDMAGGMPGAGAPDDIAVAGNTASSGSTSQATSQAITTNGAPSALIDSVIALLNKKIND